MTDMITIPVEEALPFLAKNKTVKQQDSAMPDETNTPYTKDTQLVKGPVIASVPITTDTEGRYNLNALHKAGGGETHKAPAQWLRTKQAAELVKEMSDVGIHTSPVSVNKGKRSDGTVQGTFAHELLAIEYAGWISPAFRLRVNQTFLDYKKGQMQQPVIDLDNKDFLRSLAFAGVEKVQEQREVIEEQQAVITDQQAKLDAVTPQLEKMEKRFVRPDLPERPQDTITLTAAAKQMGLTCPKLTSKLASDGYMTRDGEHWVASREVTASGLLYNHRSSYFTRKDKEWHISNQALVPKAAVEALAVLAGREVT